MFTLPLVATDDDLREAVTRWFNLVASGETSAAQAFLNIQNPEMTVNDFISRVSELTSGGKVTPPQPINRKGPIDIEALANGPISLVCRWFPGTNTTDKYAGVIADIPHHPSQWRMVES
jgi:hypothetical protein